MDESGGGGNPRVLSISPPPAGGVVVGSAPVGLRYGKGPLAKEQLWERGQETAGIAVGNGSHRLAPITLGPAFSAQNPILRALAPGLAATSASSIAARASGSRSPSTRALRATRAKSPGVSGSI